MRNLAVARRYAKALLLIGKEDGQAETYREELESFSNLLSENPALEQAVTNPLYDAAGRRHVLETVMDKQGLTGVLRAFLLLIFEKGRFGFVKHINDFYQKLADELRGVGRATLVTAMELPSDTVEKIREALSKMTGNDVKLEVEQDPDLIGGIVTKVGDLVLDGSIRTQLQNMRESLKRGESV